MSISRPGEHPLDVWTLVHTGSGLALGLLGLPWWLALALLMGFEVFEAGLRRVQRHGRGLFEHESWPNIIVDIVVGMVGWVVGWWIQDQLGWTLLS